MTTASRVALAVVSVCPNLIWAPPQWVRRAVIDKNKCTTPSDVVVGHVQRECGRRKDEQVGQRGEAVDQGGKQRDRKIGDIPPACVRRGEWCATGIPCGPTGCCRSGPSSAWARSPAGSDRRRCRAHPRHG